MAEPKYIPVFSPSGEAWEVPEANLDALLKQGFRVETQEERDEKKAKEKFEGTIGQAASGVLGALRGATMGVSDQLLTDPAKVVDKAANFVLDPFGGINKISNDLTRALTGQQGILAERPAMPSPLDGLDLSTGLADEISELKERNPAASGVGEVGGALASALLGASPAAAAGAAAKGLVAGGKGIGRAALRGAAEGAAEGAVYSVGQLVSEDALGETELSAEAILAHVGTGAVLGGAVGAPLGVLGGLLKPSAKKLLKASDDAAAAEQNALATIVPDSGELVGYADDLALLVRDVGSVTKGRGSVAGGSGSTAPSAFSTKFKDAARKVADDSALDALGLTGAQRASLQKKLGAKRYEALGEKLRTLETPDGQRVIGAGETAETIAGKLSTTMESHARRIGNTYKKLDDWIMSRPFPRQDAGRGSRGSAGILSDDNSIRQITDGGSSRQIIEGNIEYVVADKATETVLPSPMAVADQLRNEARRLGGSYSKKAVRKTLEDAADVYDQAPGAWTFKGAQEERRGLKAAWRDPTADSATKDAQRTIERAIKAEMERAMRAVPDDALGGGWKAAWQESNDQLSGLLAASELSSKRAVQLTGNVAFGLRDNIVGGAAAAGRLAQGEGLTGATMTGMAMAGVNKLVRERGSSLLSRAAEKAMHLDALNSAITKSMNRLDLGIKSFNSGDVARAAAVGSVAVLNKVSFSGGKVSAALGLQEAAKERSQELTELMQHPETMVDRVALSVSNIESSAPNMTAAMSQRVAKTVSFLHSKAPKPPASDFRVQPQFNDWKPTKEEAAKFARYVKAATDPLSILEDLERGTVTPEAVETIKEIYPKLFEKIQTKILENVVTSEKRLTYGKKLQLSLLFDVPLDATMTPEFKATLQKSFAAKPNEGQAGGGQRVTGIRELKLGDRMATSTQEFSR